MAARKHSLAPISKEAKAEKELMEKINNPRDSAHIVEGANIDAYLQTAELDNTLKEEENRINEEKYKKKIKELNEEINILTEKLNQSESSRMFLITEKRLLKNKLESNEDLNSAKNTITELSSCIDELNLKVSELQLNNTRLNKINVEFQRKIDEFNHRGSQSGYTSGVVGGKKTGFRPALNGYQDWT